nr:hypothetical protein Itr_chr08CG12510 [Ipomoea trifida]
MLSFRVACPTFTFVQSIQPCTSFCSCCLRCISDTIMPSFSDTGTSEELAGMLPGVFTIGVAIFVLGNLFPLEPLPPFSARDTFLPEPETCEGCEG